MYAQLFGLKQEPFSIAPDPRFLFMSERHREALAHLLYGLRAGGGFVLLSGEVGAGKTTVCRCFLEQVPETCSVAYIFNPKLSVIELLQTVCQEFGVGADLSAQPSVKDLVDALNAFLLAEHAAGRDCVLIIDEAQNLSAEVLEQLRLLTNLETNERKLLQIILIGQPELRELLAQPALEQLAQRVIARYHLQALSEPDTLQYVRHRMAVAGLTGALPFDTAALKRVHRLSRGVPRRINLLCDRALLGAYGEGRHRVDGGMIDAAAREVFDLRHGAARRWGLVGALALVGAVALAALWLRSPPGADRVALAPALAASAAPTASGAGPPALAASAAAPAAVPLGALAFAERQPWKDEVPAWRALGRLWQIDIAAADPCQAVAALGLSCHRGETTLAVLRELDRPALLVLHDAGGARTWALLAGLQADRARLQLADGPADVALAALAAQWRGEFATLWRRPPGYADRSAGREPSAELNDWLGTRLAAFQGDALPARATLRQKVEAFQRAQGLSPDGLAGPMTLMQLNRAAGEPEPRLQGN